MSFACICFIVHGRIKQLINTKSIKVFVILLSRAFGSNHNPSLGVDNCKYDKNLLSNDSLSIYMIFIITANNLFLIG